MPVQTLSKEELRVWTGLVSKGIANALHGLSEMAHHQMIVTSLDLRWMPVKAAASFIGGVDSEGVGIYLAIEGDASGHMLLIYNLDMAYRLVDVQMGVPVGSTIQLGEMERSVLGEAGNVMGAFFLNSFADASDMVLMPSPPAVVSDLIRAIVNVPLVFILGGQDDALIVKVTFSAENQDFEGKFIILPSTDFIRKILERQKAGHSCPP